MSIEIVVFVCFVVAFTAFIITAVECHNNASLVEVMGSLAIGVFALCVGTYVRGDLVDGVILTLLAIFALCVMAYARKNEF